MGCVYRGRIKKRNFRHIGQRIHLERGTHENERGESQDRCKEDRIGGGGGKECTSSRHQSQLGGSVKPIHVLSDGLSQTGRGEKDRRAGGKCNVCREIGLS